MAMLRSADGGRTSVVQLASLFVGFGSVALVVDTWTVLVTAIPKFVPLLTFTVSVSVAVEPAANDATVQVSEPPESALQASPVERWNVVPVAIVSESTTVPGASLGPLFAAVIV